MIELLKHRFLENMVRHPNLDWAVVEKFLRNNPKAIQTLRLMEESGGEPDLLQLDSGELIFCDCLQESPALRRSLCYDNEALSLRKKNPPAGSAMAQASQMGLELLTESLYRQLQETGEYDTKTSSWIATPSTIRSLGGALFCERRYDTVFTFHNGADSYYSVRGWRGYFCFKG